MTDQRQVFDCFTFSTESLLLEARIRYLDPVVDYFVIVEADRTHQGTPRELVLPTLRDQLAPFWDKIIYVSVHDLPSEGNWEREQYQRRAILRGLDRATDDDLVIISDVDEIPRREVIGELRASLKEPVSLGMRFSYYSVNMQTDEVWNKAKAGRLVDVVDPQDFRMRGGLRVLPEAGWHVSYLGNVEQTQLKLRSFAHAEYSGPHWTSERHIRRCMRLGVRMFGGALFNIVDDSEAFPGISRTKHPELFQRPLSRLERRWAHLYLRVTEERHRLPLWLTDHAPLLAAAALPLLRLRDRLR